MNRRFELTDQEWERLAPLLPSTKPQRGGRWRDHRQVLNGILFRTRTGVPWRDLPARYGPWEMVSKRFARWQTDGTWARIEAALRIQADAAGEWTGLPRSTPVWCGPTSTPPALARGAPTDPGKPPASAGRSRGGLTTKLHTICDGRGRNLATRLTPGQDADTTQLVGLVDQVRVARHATRSPDRRQGLLQPCQPGGPAGPPHPPHHPRAGGSEGSPGPQGCPGGRPPTFDRERYRQRNQVERLMNRRKQFRAVATRFDKLAVRYQATVVWLTSSSGCVPGPTGPAAIREPHPSPESRASVRVQYP
jgi:transposase